MVVKYTGAWDVFLPVVMLFSDAITKRRVVLLMCGIHSKKTDIYVHIDVLNKGP